MPPYSRLFPNDSTHAVPAMPNRVGLWSYLQRGGDAEQHLPPACDLRRVKAVRNLVDELMIEKIVHRQVVAERAVTPSSCFPPERQVESEMCRQSTGAVLELHWIAGTVFRLERSEHLLGVAKTVRVGAVRF